MQTHSRRLVKAGVLGLVFLFCIVTTIASPAQTFTTLYAFCHKSGCADGWSPAGLLQANNGDFYGATWFGGASSACGTDGCGTLFKMTNGGTLTALSSFDGTDGAVPWGAVQATNGVFYGATIYGGTGTSSACGSDGCGTVFKITAGGTLTTLHDFDFTDGSHPNGVVQATDGNFYGTTWTGGASSACGSDGCGTVFKITAGGTLTTLHSFNAKDGSGPLSWLVQASNGNLYGTTRTPPGGEGGAYGYGTVFEITPSGTLTTLHSFDGKDGAYPYAGLVQATNGNLYGTTTNGGANNACDSGCGTIFKITPAGAFTTLYNFCTKPNCTDGAGPYGLVQGTDGNFYGTTAGGGTSSACGAHGCGTVFKITAGGTLTTLHDFDFTDGEGPFYVVQATNGKFYGVTNGGASDDCPENPTTGATGCGTVFDLSVGLGPFVETRPTSGKEGAKIGILGQGFSSSSVVKFGGTTATTIVRSGTTFITATVPAEALTGKVTVTTGTITLNSAQTFRVLPTISSFTPPSGPVGTSVIITGTGLEQTTKVTFDGKSGSFTVNSDAKVTADVPTGATTGKIAVTTKGGSAASTASFTVN